MILIVNSKYAFVYHDIIVEKLPIGHVNSLLKFIVPEGRYLLNTTWSMSKIPRAEVLVYFTK